MKKSLKCFVSLLIAATLLLSLCTSAFAAETYPVEAADSTLEAVEEAPVAENLAIEENSIEEPTLVDLPEETVTEDNYMDLFKLVEFSTIYYGDAIDYFDFKRDRLEMALKGLYMCNSRYEDNTAKFYEFAYENIKKYEDNKEKEKSITNN